MRCMSIMFRYGIDNKAKALQRFEEALRNTGRDVQLQCTGLFVNPEYPWLGTSPDAIVYDPSEDSPLFRTRSHRRLQENVAPTHSSTIRVATTQLDVAGSVDKGLCDSSSASPSATTPSSEPTQLTG
ncbi:hypothetical protein HPB49_019038 [Dermacentor silvarum]|uniref:Uncharacterized protein n=1 Tax=Dermacentor silvarum TaxID=543639 RepID=A0ACB8CME9_DERSI|nr:hypothetical protein HPB49_019038 [Dermacentor silvarum]